MDTFKILGIFWKFLGILEFFWEFFGNCLGILCEFFGILWEFFIEFFRNHRWEFIDLFVKTLFLSRFWVKAEEGRRTKFKSLEVREASSSHLKRNRNE
jgi:hypothetical protein